MSRFQDAHASLKAGLEKFPDSKLLLLGLAKTYAVQKRFDDAVLTLDDYRKTQPDLVDLEHEAAAYRIGQKNSEMRSTVCMPYRPTKSRP